MTLFLSHKMKLKWLLLIYILVSVKSQEFDTENNTETDQIAQEVSLSENQGNVASGLESNVENGVDETIQNNAENYGNMILSK